MTLNSRSKQGKGSSSPEISARRREKGINTSRLGLLILIGVVLAAAGEAVPRETLLEKAISQLLFFTAIVLAGGTILALFFQIRISKRIQAATLTGVAVLLFERILLLGQIATANLDFTWPAILVWIAAGFLRVGNTTGIALLILGILFALLDISQQNLNLRREQRERERSEALRADLQNRVVFLQRFKSLGVLAGGIAHDFNNLLTRIAANAGLLEEDAFPDSDSKQRFSVIGHAVSEGTVLSRRLLACSGKGHFIMKTVRLADLVRSQEPLLRSLIPAQLTLQFSLDDGTPDILADEEQIEELLVDLIHNAAESIQNGEGVISVSVGSVRAERTGLDAFYPNEPQPGEVFSFLDVIDDGCGIDIEALEQVFEPFFTTKGPGRGLGLSAALGVVTGHNGFISLRLREEGGTEVRVLFPIATDESPVDS